ncbi:MAG: GIY-YIG nuclease family protein [Chloroflexota bacterium]
MDSENRNGKPAQDWFFYIVRCRDKSLYCGITNNLEDRLKEHNNGTGAKFTRSRRPVTMVYNEKYNNISEARKREAQIKSWSKAKKEDLITGFPRLRRNKFLGSLGINESCPFDHRYKIVTIE